MSVKSMAKARAERGLASSRPMAANVVPAEIWCVIDEDGRPHFSASWAETCHEHINDAIADDVDGAIQWVVRKYVLA